MKYFSATTIFSGQEFFNEDSVIIVDAENKIVDVVSNELIDNSNIQYFEGIITPGFVNTHCHLELSHLKSVIPQHRGIVGFGLEIIKQRNDLPVEKQQELMLQADKAMYDAGIVLVGDISNTTNSIQAKKQSKITYHTFVELMGLNPTRADEVFDKGREVLTQFIIKDLSASFAPHAPYSTSPQLINYISSWCKQAKQATSIHNQESQAENDFFETKTGDYLKLYEALNIPLDFFEATKKTSLQIVLPFFNADVNTLLVHNTFTSPADIEIAQQQLANLYWCLCPKANQYIENTLPPINLLLNHRCAITLGTDSLASNNSLSIMDEINVLVKHFPTIKLEQLLQAATYNGAQFLNQLTNFGSIEKNKQPGLNLLTKVNNEYQVQKII